MKGKLTAMFMLAGAMELAAVGITSPNGELLLNVDVDAGGSPYYTLDYKGKPLVKQSRLGLRADETEFRDGFVIAGTDTVTVDRSWQPVWGEYSDVRDHFRELAVRLKAENPNRELTVRFRLFDDGLGFRYELPVQDGPNYLTLKDELTEFNYAGDHKLYCIPGDYDTDEYLWSETTFTDLPEALSNYGRHTEAQRVDGVTIQTPMLLKT
ncbi:MAG: glycoside hydrolase family 97 N-terminal domain-containing protein, partial [Muribaculaceae bacterium]|nr:glycoside hydrolase family 97 N-terminal domain-containing protein [Muribaculaceae bacterium]